MRTVKNGCTFFFHTEDPLSNWHPSPFIHRGLQFNCSEQYMMWAKADLFGDYEIANRILRARDPQKQKMLGRQVKNFDPVRWNQESHRLVREGLVEKFRQNPHLLRSLLSTGDTELVEASPYDKIWGIGMGEGDPHVTDKTKWGENRLGVLLTDVREQLKQEVTRGELTLPSDEEALADDLIPIHDEKRTFPVMG